MVMYNKYIPFILMILSFFILVVSLNLFLYNNLILFEFELFNIMEINFIFPLMMDYSGMLFSFIVLFISSNVMNFSKIYMSEDKWIERFTLLVLTFVLSMNLLIYIPNLIFLLLGWDGLGITSFVLVIYYLNNKSLSAGMITAITNRVGDVMLLLSIMLCINQCHWSVMNMWYNMLLENKIQILLIMLAGMTKSAQIPFSSWLPAAMAAPTPVSALVHSSTLVTAGVFLLFRFYYYLSAFYLFNYFLLTMSVLTMIMAGLAASVEWDMKKIIALSTLSQLGLMMSMMSLNMPELAFMHMVVHALFKALLFICAGNLIMNYFHSQDLRWMGNATYQFPMTSMCIMLANLSMVGFPFLSSFYTKDLILETVMYNNSSFGLVIMMYLSVGITMFYSFRFCMNLLWMLPLSCSLVSLNEEKNVITSMMFMSILSILISVFMMWVFPMKLDMNIMMTYMYMMPMFIILMGFIIGVSWCIFSMDIEFSSQLMNNMMWFMVPLSTQVILKYSLPYMKLYLEMIDQSWLEYVGGLGLYKLFNKMTLMVYMYMEWSIMYMIKKMFIFSLLVLWFIIIM
uniref:NADH dehydrogenase subunit 5 n=1 Tax=Poecilobdella javanica TaxID=1348077 RepID=UPI001F13268B|nr:NADH dehydrogenase subunit 5 [Poecilobdella javanica]ULO25929.1 NADH dehydrogenase subunit 5 [Poecilobdella javanica]